MSSTPSPQKHAILLRFHEVALKGGNRGWFEEKLMTNAKRLLKRAFAGAGGSTFDDQIHRVGGRILVEGELDEAKAQALSRVFGITGFSAVKILETDKQKILEAAVEEFDRYVAERGVPRTFRIRTKRSEKALPDRSLALDREIGTAIHAKYPALKVDLDKPEVSLGLEIRREQSYMWLSRRAGPGGLPVGTNSPVLALISGGIDSPIAALKMLRRGCPVNFIHFYGAPFVGPEVLEKIEDLVRIVNRYQPVPKPVMVVPFGKMQEEIALATNPKLRTILYRRMMFRIACAAAPRVKAQAVVTGESLGQVASQTLENLTVINEAARLPVLRPLLGHDKDEIVNESKRWGTYETSIRPGIDCCTLFADRHPAIHASAEAIAREEAKFPVDELVARALESIENRRAD